MNEKKQYIIVEDAYLLRDNILLGIYAAHELQHLKSITEEDIVCVFSAIDGFQDIIDEYSLYDDARKDALLKKIRSDMKSGQTSFVVEEFAAGDSTIEFIQSNSYHATQLALIIIDGDLCEHDYGNIGFRNDPNTEYYKPATITSGSELAKLLIQQNSVPVANLVGATNSNIHANTMSKLGINKWIDDKYNFIDISTELHQILVKKTS